MKTSILAIFISLFTFSIPAIAYIDPGSGSVIMSAIVGFFVAAGMAIKTYWYKLKSFFTGKKNKKAPMPPAAEQEKQENA